MKIDVKDVNPAFLEIVKNPKQSVFLDANILFRQTEARLYRLLAVVVVLYLRV